MDFRAIYEKRFHGPLAYILIINTPFENTNDARKWIERQKIHRNMRHENYTLVRVMGHRTGMFKDKEYPTMVIEYEGPTKETKNKIIQEYKIGVADENTDG